MYTSPGTIWVKSASERANGKEDSTETSAPDAYIYIYLHICVCVCCIYIFTYIYQSGRHLGQICIREGKGERRQHWDERAWRIYIYTYMCMCISYIHIYIHTYIYQSGDHLGQICIREGKGERGRHWDERAWRDSERGCECALLRHPHHCARPQVIACML